MNRNLAGRITALEAQKNSGIEIWFTADDEHVVHQHDGRKLRRSELPDDGRINVIIRHFSFDDLESEFESEVL